MQLKYEITKSQSLSHWLYAGIRKKDINAPLESFYAPVNMGEAYVQIVYPQRKWFLEHHNLKGIKRYKGDYDAVYFPFEDSKVNFSTAIRTTTHIWTYLKSTVDVPKNGKFPFSIATCGGIKLWVDGKETLIFTPYDRNIPHKQSFSIQLEKGKHEFEIYADELAERDVFFYFDFLYLGEEKIVQSVDVKASPKYIHEAESFLSTLSLTRTSYCFGGIEADFDSSMLTKPITLNVENISDEKLSFRIEMGMNTLPLLQSFQDIGQKKAIFTVSAGNVEVKRKVFYNKAPKTLTDLPSHDTVEERKKEALSFAAKYGGGLVHQAMAIMNETGKITQEARKCIERSLEQIERKEDCADFVMAPLIWSLIRNGNLYSSRLYDRAKKAVLEFRYWIDEKGNDAMWYFSENHAFLFNVSQYLAGILYPDEIFTVSGRTGREQRMIGKSRLFTWFRNFSLYHYAEWNSATYFPVDLIGLFSLYEAAEDEDIREKTKEALDYTFRIIRDNSNHGLMSSSFGRAYEMTVKAKEENEPSFLSYVAFGEGWATLSNRATALFSLSSYVPELISPDTLTDLEMRIVRCVHGEENVWTYSAATSSYILASAENFKPFRHGHQQHIMDCTIGKEASFFINHPGEKAYSGENRPSYWSGNGTLPMAIQYKALMLMLFEIEEKEVVKYIHAYFPTWLYDEWSIEGNNVFARSGDGYIGVRFSSLPRLTETGMNKNREIIAEGERQLCMIRCANAYEVSSFKNFKKLFKAMDVSFDAEKIEGSVNDFSYGLLKCGKEITPTLNGKPYDWKCESGYAREFQRIKKI